MVAGHGSFTPHVDAIVGRLMDTLDDLGVADRTLVIVTSDNRPELPTVQHMRQTHDHDGARPWRDLKRDNREGRHRVLLIARWPGVVAPGRESAQTISLTDLMATVAQIVAHQLPEEAHDRGHPPISRSRTPTDLALPSPPRSPPIRDRR